jgi:glycosyltransferase involved in cell wall biosynthesis
MELLIPNSCEIVDKVSIAIPIYNCVEYVDECLDSILSQEFMLLLLEEHDYEDVSSTIGDGNNTSPKKQMMIAIEVSIYEDGSTDGTAELVDEWAKRVRKNETVFSLFSVKISKNSTGSPKGGI